MTRRILTLHLAASLIWFGDHAHAQTPGANGSPPALAEHNGVLYWVEKVKAESSDRIETKLFHRPGQSISETELRVHVAAQAPSILTPELRRWMDLATPEQQVDLVVLLRSQPTARIAREISAVANAQMNGLNEQIQGITRRSLSRRSMRPEEERGVVPLPLEPGDAEQRRVLASRLDDLEADVRRQTARGIEAAVRPDQDALAAFVEDLGGQVTTRISTMNIIGLRIAAANVGRLAVHPLVALIDLNHPGQPELDNHQFSLGLTTGFWAAGITGGVHDVGVLDTGVQQNHPALSTHPFISNIGATDPDGHGTGMAGILASTSVVFPGMAFGCDTIVVSRAGAIATSMTGMDFIAGTGEPENVNYSFGNGTASGSDYTPTDQFFDGAIATFGFMVSKSTGNNGYHATLPTITHPAPAYNLLASANMNDFNTITRDDDRITSSSSVGPTVAGRKKPDITAPGNNTMSTDRFGGFSNIGGTSAASPHTGGGIVLLRDLGTPSAMAAKAVLINTADAMSDNGTATTADDFFVAGSLWNRRYGWGYLNLGAAYLHGLDVFVSAIPDEPEEADYRLYVGQMYVNEKATLVWQRHVAYNGAMFPTVIETLSDLDLFAYREPDNIELARSDSPIDNVEQLHSPEDAIVVLKVEASGTFDPDIETEAFALATQENFLAATGPAFTIAIPDLGIQEAGAVFKLEVTLTNTGDLAGHSLLIELSGITVLKGENPAAVVRLTTGETRTVSWIVRAALEPGSYPISVSVRSDSYGEVFTATGVSSYEVGLPLW